MPDLSKIGKPEKESSVKAGMRVLISIAIGALVTGLVASMGAWQYAPLAGWDITCVVFLAWVWIGIHDRDAEATASLALREDPGRAIADGLLLIASLAALGAVAVLLVEAGNSSGTGVAIKASFAVISVILSWAVVHSIFALRYARMFYQSGGGVDFNNAEPPTYSDFGYLAFTIGMTYQVSDTTFKSIDFRKLALRHALLSYLFGTVIVASAINLLAGLNK
jgi:uncharacterized membrane protein